MFPERMRQEHLHRWHSLDGSPEEAHTGDIHDAMKRAPSSFSSLPLQSSPPAFLSCPEHEHSFTSISLPASLSHLDTFFLHFLYSSRESFFLYIVKEQQYMLKIEKVEKVSIAYERGV